MNIVATAVDPEYVKVEHLGGGALCLTIEIARMQCTEVHNTKTGSIQINLLPADVDTLTRGLADILAKARADMRARS